jgi:hypothetical protein
MNRPATIWLYRITHIDNLEHIFRHGLVTAVSPLANPDFVRIGDNTLINYRKDLDAHMPPGGKLSEYIPFYLGPRSPMLYQIATGFEGIKKFPQEEIVYLISSVPVIKQHGLSYFFSDGHVRSKTSSTYADDEDFDKLDWDVIYATHWQPDETDLKRKQKKQAEFLVRHAVPLSCIQYIGVFNQKAENTVVNLLKKHHLQVPVRVSAKKLYYDHL